MIARWNTGASQRQIGQCLSVPGHLHTRTRQTDPDFVEEIRNHMSCCERVYADDRPLARFWSTFSASSERVVLMYWSLLLAIKGWSLRDSLRFIVARFRSCVSMEDHV
mmetsp:Transcript_34301/g.91662  ORF Transcript_34301/g.91662 Transcript_34301/m.91662 type:complete len:108 (-) Transcript_34301:44-367(-)